MNPLGLITHAMKAKKKADNKRKQNKRQEVIKQEQAIQKKRQEKAILNKYTLDSEGFDFDKETKGLTQYQKRKVRTKLNKLKEKEFLEKPPLADEDTQKTLESLTRAIEGKKIIDDIESYEASGGLVNNAKAYSSKLRLKNLQKKDKRLKKKEKRKGIPLFTGFSILSFVVFLFMVNFLAWGSFASIALSHPEIIKELYEAGFLGDALTVGNVAEDVIIDGKVVVKGIGADARQGCFVYNGVNSCDNIGSYNTDKGDDTGSTADVDFGSGDFPKIVWDYFIGLGWTPEATAGILGNMETESGVCPVRLQGSSPCSDNPAIPTQADLNNYGPAGGIVQWENINGPSARFAELTAYAANQNKSVWSIETQLAFIVYELSSGYESNNMVSWASSYGYNGSTGMAAYGSVTDVEDATTLFLKSYERASAEAIASRVSAAKSYYSKFK